MMYNCPVCGYDRLAKPPRDFYICPCCGTEFDADDFDRAFAELRSDWIEKGMPWFSRSTLQPKNWNAYRQLIIANYGNDLAMHPRFESDVNYKYAVNRAFSEVSIAKELRALRERKNERLTQSQLAAKADMKQSRISELEGMDYSSWSISTLERLAKALNVAFSYSFITWDELVSRIRADSSKSTSPSQAVEYVQATAPEPESAYVFSSQQGYDYQHGMAAIKMFGLLSKEKNVLSMEHHKQNRPQISDDENSQISDDKNSQKQQRDAGALSYSATAKAG